MSNLSKEILIKLSVDGKEFSASVSQAKHNLNELNAQVENTSRSNFDLNNSTKQAAYNTREMDSSITGLNSSFSNADEILRDFFDITRAVLVSLPDLIQGFAGANAGASGLSNTISKQLISSFKGPAGLNIAVSSAILLLDILPIIFRKINEESEKAAREGFENFITNLNKMTSSEISSELENIKKKLKDINDERKRFFSTANQPGGTSPSFINVAASQIDKNDEIAELLQLEAAEEKFSGMVVSASNLRGKLELQINNINNILKHKLPSFGGVTDELAEAVKEYGIISNDVYEINQKLIDQRAELRKKLNDLDKTTQQRETEKAEAERRRIEEQQRQADERKRMQYEYINGITEQYELQRKLNELEGKSNEDNIRSTQQLIDEELKHNLSLENKVKLFTLEKELREEIKKFSLDDVNLPAAPVKGLQSNSAVKTLSGPFLPEEERERLAREQIDDVFTLKRREATIEYQIAKEKYGDLELLRKSHQKKLAKIDQEEVSHKLKLSMQTFSLAAGMFVKHTAAYKAFAIGNTIIDTYQSAVAAYKSAAAIPFIGHVLGPIAAAAAIKFGFDQVAAISGTNNSMPGYAKGGAVIGENGPEIIAPFQDYASGQSKLITMTMMTLKEELKMENGRLVPYAGWKKEDGNIYSNELKAVLNKLNKRLDDGIDSRAYLDDRQAKKIYSRGSALNRRSKI